MFQGSGPELIEDGQVLAAWRSFSVATHDQTGLLLAKVVPLRSKSRQVRQNEVLESSLFHFHMYPGLAMAWSQVLHGFTAFDLPGQGGTWPPRPIALIGQGLVHSEAQVQH